MDASKRKGEGKGKGKGKGKRQNAASSANEAEALPGRKLLDFASSYWQVSAYGPSPMRKGDDVHPMRAWICASVGEKSVLESSWLNDCATYSTRRKPSFSVKKKKKINE